ncbi:MAG: hypothetical protein ABEH66_00910 [Halobacteriales archaeon]
MLIAGSALVLIAGPTLALIAGPTLAWVEDGPESRGCFGRLLEQYRYGQMPPTPHSGR